MPSFDIVSKIELQEVDNAVNQAKKAILNRYDLKNAKISLDWDPNGKKIIVKSEDDYKLSAALDILRTKLIRRKISLKSLDYGEVEKCQGTQLKQQIIIQEGITADNSKVIIKAVKDSKLRVQTQRMDDMLRVTGKKVDDLQTVISLIKNKNMNIELQFINMRN